MEKNSKEVFIKKYFENIETIDIAEASEENKSIVNYSEEYHLDGVKDEIKDIYNKIKTNLSLETNKIIYNPQRYYISLRKKRNFAYIKIRKSKIIIVVMLHIDEVKKRIKEHKIKELSEGIQKFYNGNCCQVLIESNKNLDEITSLLLEIQK
ncbi:DUF5655 domain-containing protein [Haliovirga abyssi]|uniref:DUF5655 domain-containing protein n=1 Tax=Haliovirga abyssi TaxID=2996794 RepID=A0AAU9DQY8_9FUSO|nr:DUF5655 domain-containing protein [Haliovirga abyssi]BDU50938.1 hypothetical protein HLVA_15070 [Haliovirga abyssi]